MRPNTIHVESARIGARITMEGVEPRTGALMSMGSDYTRDTVRRLVEDLCRCAGLPEPWKG
jgi:hypothetical protein